MTVRFLKLYFFRKNNKLLHTTPPCMKKQCLLKVQPELTKYLQPVKSDCTLRKIKSEATCRLDRDRNDYFDMISMQMAHGNHIKEVTVPFNVKLYS